MANVAKNRRKHEKRRELQKLAGAAQRAGLRAALEFAVTRRVDGVRATAVLQHHPDRNPSRLGVAGDNNEVVVVLPILNDMILLAGDSIALPISALEAIQAELLASAIDA